MLDAVNQRLHGGRLHQVGLADEDLVGKPDLAAHLLAGAQLLLGVLGVDQGQHRVEQIALGDLVIHEEGLGHGAGVGEAGGLDHDTVELQLAAAALGARSASVVRRSSRMVQQTQPLLIWMTCSSVSTLRDVVVDVLLAELVLDDGDLLTMGFGQDALEQRRLARSPGSP